MKNKSRLLELLDREREIRILKGLISQLENVENLINEHYGQDFYIYSPYQPICRSEYKRENVNFVLNMGYRPSWNYPASIPFITKIFTLEEMNAIVDITFSHSEYTIPSYEELIKRIREYIVKKKEVINKVLNPLLEEVAA